MDGARRLEASRADIPAETMSRISHSVVPPLLGGGAERIA
jgi:hypothetical protein